MFSIRKKDGLARIGTLITNHGKISTPVLLPVINPNKQLLHPEKMVKCGAEAFITNAYLLFRDPINHTRVLENGLHRTIGFSGPLMTDSGAYQLMEYGEVSVTNKEITLFQEQIGSDIGVFLDIPTKGGNFEEIKTASELTLKRADEHIQSRDSECSILWAGPIQGGEISELFKRSCLEMAQKNFNIHPIGSVVPLLEKYDFKTVIQMLLNAKQYLPFNRPIHLFGAGHPMFFAIAIFLGVDIFDSAAYILYAKKNRYLTVFGTGYLEKMQYLPCSCEVCRNHTVRELLQLNKEDRIKLLAIHNLIVSLEEIRRSKQAIIEGRIYELVISRVMNHPSLAQTLDLLFGIKTSQFIEKYDPLSKARAILFTHPILKNRPSILRYKQRLLERFYSWSKKLVIGQDFQKLHSSSSYQVIRLSPLFGVIPDELRGVFPLVQHERIPMSFSSEIIDYINQFLKIHSSKFKHIEIHPSIDLGIEIFDEYDRFQRVKEKIKLEDVHIINSILNYQFGNKSHKILRNRQISVERSTKTGIIRRFSDDSELLGTLRASDFVIIPTESFARCLHEYIPEPRLRVVAAKESHPYLLEKKDLLAKFVINVDSEIRCGEEVFIVDENDSFLSFGRSVLAASEMLAFDHGIAVRVRR
ncbi:MAG: tRNA guanosine(15) transglycosylase TgtA [Candidatus Hodarchaeales archaeon]|jgi:7-cyano-7-deazaguanine tRNA-ribosyltransferase